MGEININIYDYLIVLVAFINFLVSKTRLWGIFYIENSFKVVKCTSTNRTNLKLLKLLLKLNSLFDFKENASKILINTK